MTQKAKDEEGDADVNVDEAEDKPKKAPAKRGRPKVTISSVTTRTHYD